MICKDIEQAQAYTLKIFPDLRGLKIDTSRQGHQGWTLIFPDCVGKLPKTQAVLDGMKSEVSVLNSLRKNGVAGNPFISIPEVINFDRDNNALMLSRLSGTQPDFALSVETDLQHDLGQRLGVFLACMHDALEGGVYEAQSYHTAMLNNVANSVSTLKKSCARESDIARLNLVSSYIEQFDDIDDGWTFVHGDISMSNVVYHQHNGFGLVDFTSTQPFYRHMDFARLLQKFPSEVLISALDSYQAATGRKYSLELIQTASDYRTILTSVCDQNFTFSAPQLSL